MGPMRVPAVVVMEPSAFAADRCSGGSRRGIIDVRAGELSAPHTAWRDTTA